MTDRSEPAKKRGPRRVKPLRLSSYSPKFTDPRVTARIQKALAFCADELSEDYDRPLPKEKLEEAFGPVGNKLGDWLRANLLTRSDQYVPGVQFYKYRLRAGALDKIAAKASTASPISFVNTSSPEAVIARKKALFADQLSTFSFQYELKSDRYWHPLQNLKRPLKEQLWHDLLPYNYDIEACAPTLLIQTAKKAGFLDILAGPIEDYVSNRIRWRQHVADLTGLSLDDSKRLLNSFFNGARLAKTSHCAAYRTLSEQFSAAQASEAMERLQNDRDLKVLRGSIKAAWGKLERKLKVSFKTSKNKWILYFKLERRVLDAMKDYLERSGNSYFTEHDGFRSRLSVDVDALVNHVKDKTGYEINLEQASARTQ